ncbi:MAG: hypothetical protein LBU48_05270, partial [Coriobacteriales bacterium]|nr:hypothetical protein [Coriobacteriales bacterium]
MVHGACAFERGDGASMNGSKAQQSRAQRSRQRYRRAATQGSGLARKLATIILALTVALALLPYGAFAAPDDQTGSDPLAASPQDAQPSQDSQGNDSDSSGAVSDPDSDATSDGATQEGSEEALAEKDGQAEQAAPTTPEQSSTSLAPKDVAALVEGAALSALGGALRPLSTEQFQFEVTVASGDSFTVPAYGFGHDYDWHIEWGDGSTSDAQSSYGGGSSSSLQHTYSAANTYTITLRPNGSEYAWLAAFGFGEGWSSTSAPVADRDKITRLISPIKPSMTRTQEQLNDGTAPNGEWSATFFGCKNLIMGPAFTFDQAAWAGITTVGDNFASSMFSGCDGDAFTMNSIFNLPQAITTVGEGFVDSMFRECSGAAFNMNSVFNLPAGIVDSVGNNFASELFWGCSGDAFTMNSIFNLPARITATDSNFAGDMFSYCSGAAFNMNSVFNLPVGITTVTSFFASNIFSYCANNVFTMNDVFNLPQGIVTGEAAFAFGMFSGAGGSSFQINSIFAFPKYDFSMHQGKYNFANAFADLDANTPQQLRTITSIIGTNDRHPIRWPATFMGSSAFFSDWAFCDEAWGGGHVEQFQFEVTVGAGETFIIPL